MKRLSMVALMLMLTLSLSSCKNKNKWDIPDVQGPTLTQVDNGLLLSAVLEKVNLNEGARVPIPEYPTSYVELTPDFESSGTVVSIFVSAQDLDAMLNGGLDLLDPTTLPGGRPLPGVLGGTLPGIAFNVEMLYNMSFYIGPKLFGIFVPVNLNMGGAIVTHRFYVKEVRVGNISIVSNDENGENGGFIVMLDLTDAVKAKISQMAKK